LVEDYLADCRARGLSPKTLRDAYGYSLQRVLLPWCEEQGLTQAGQLDTRTLNRFTSDLLEHGGRRGQLSRHTVEMYVRNVNLFLGWCRREGEIGDVRAQAPKLPRRVLDVLTREEIDRLEEAAVSERDKVIVRLLADTGIRASELLGLRSADLVEQGRGPLPAGPRAEPGWWGEGRQGSAGAFAAAVVPANPEGGSGTAG
jgi:integrase